MLTFVSYQLNIETMKTFIAIARIFKTSKHISFTNISNALILLTF